MRKSIYKYLYEDLRAFVVLAVLIVFSSTSFAQVQQEKRQAPPMGQLPQEQNQLAVTYEDEIMKDELPEAVISSVKENYSDFKISEAYRGSDGSYKIKLEHEKNKIAAYYDAAGDFLRIENDKGEETINDDWR